MIKCETCKAKYYCAWAGSPAEIEECGIHDDIATWNRADAIRNMSEDELATFLNTMQSNAYHCGSFGRWNKAYPHTNEEWQKWLREENNEHSD